jgi:SAM-dependent methyltransferase
MLMYPNEYRVMFELEDRYWWYRGVRTLLRTWLDRYAPRPARILDGGCGTGANLKLLQRYGTAFGVDIAESAIGFCRARGIPPQHLTLASLDELPFPDDFFDVVISLEVICNIADDQRALDEIARVLKPDGRAIIQVPAYQWLWSRHDVAVGHKRRYTARDLRAKLARTGLHIERLTHANMMMLPPIALKRLISRFHREQEINSDLVPLPSTLNALLSALYIAEMQLVARVDVPCGVSLVALVRKDGGRRTKDEGRKTNDEG